MPSILSAVFALLYLRFSHFGFFSVKERVDKWLHLSDLQYTAEDTEKRADTGSSINPGQLPLLIIGPALQEKVSYRILGEAFSVIDNELTRGRLTKQYTSAHKPLPLSTNCMNCPPSLFLLEIRIDSLK